MAKSSSFFGLRKGSTKSLTFSILDGKQVTKDRVINVRNPQTIAQASQRYKLASLCNSWRMLSGICDHSFEGIAYGTKSRQKFMSLNLSGVDVIPVLKGTSYAIPYNLCISKGSLYNPLTIDKSYTVPLTGLEDKKGVTEAWINAVLAAFPSLKRGDQITMYIVAGQANVFVFEDKEYPISGFRVARIVLDPSSPVNEGLEYTAADKLFTTKEGFIINVETMFLSPNLSDTAPIAQGSIISRQVNGMWLRSTAIIECESEATVLELYPNAYRNAAIASYAATASAASSTKYLNQAEPNF